MKNKIFAAFGRDGTLVNGVWGFDRASVETTISDRISNGDAFPGERVRVMKIEDYNRELVAQGFPPFAIAYKIDVAETVRLMSRGVVRNDHLR